MDSSTTETVYGRWSLQHVDPNHSQTPLSFSIGNQTGDGDNLASEDTRILVARNDIQPGGKYYSIVKLRIRFEGQDSQDPRWAQATGWLIRPDLVVTAGYCAFDHTYRFGKAIQVCAWAGYSGASSTGSPNVQFRSGVEIVTTKAWIDSDTNLANTIAFIRVDKQFNHIVPIQYEATPTLIDHLVLGIVGYPDDKTHHSELGALMYQDFDKATCDLTNTPQNMIQYNLFTYGDIEAQIGSPVLITNTNTAIGVHAGSPGGQSSATAIQGQYGNSFGGLLNAIDGSGTVMETVQGIDYVKV
ncbi:glutamyl endopeptidase [Fusarium longipes]|uniref:Glutamyl endopeptidase n=1 Tax=Fusarium longipes TaxID=694270 RepID=A0A395SZ64_9HYPO|nr:glutamyl endopeptidase [Fusarium longipes]